MTTIDTPKNSLRENALPGFKIVVVALTLYTTVYRFFMWDVVTGFLNYRIPLLLKRLGFSQIQFHIDNIWINDWITIFVILSAGALLLLTHWKYLSNRSFWLTSLVVVALLAITGLSWFWSVERGYTYARFLLFLAAALGGILIAWSYKKSSIRMILETFAFIMMLGSIFMLIFFPNYSIAWGGSARPDFWIGMFGWKMPFAMLMGFAIILFLFRLLEFKELKLGTRVYSIVSYIIAWFLLIKSYSITELLAVVAIHGVVIFGWLYLKWGHHLKLVHWWALAGLVVVGIVAAWFGRGILLGLVGRDVNFTGRLPMWSSLVPVIRERLLFGYGFGEAFWKNEIYYLPIWKLFPNILPKFAHSGYVDAMINNGIVGFVLWIVFLTQGMYISLRYFIRQHTLPALIFFSWFLFTAVISVGNDHMGSYEYFTWLLMVISFAFLVRDGIERKQTG